MKLTLAYLLTVAAAVAAARPARACGGGVVSTQNTSIGANAQRIVLSVHDGVTDVVTQVGVPQTTADYGLLIPVPSEPTLDPNPVSSADIDKLFEWSQPRVRVRPEVDDDILPHCGCGSASKGGGTGGTQVGAPVTIGPVTAMTLTGDTGGAVNTWLADNGFVLNLSYQSIIDDYSGPGRYFIVIRRSDTAATGAPSSVGVHFTLAGDERGLPLRFAYIGSGDHVGFTVLVAADQVVGPSAPFQALTLDDLDAGALRTSYYSALATAVQSRSGLAFVLEGAWTGAELSAAGTWPSLQPFIRSTQQVTRLSSVIREYDLSGFDTDVRFDQPFAGTVPHERIVQRPSRHPKLAFAFATLAFAAVARRRRRGVATSSCCAS